MSSAKDIRLRSISANDARKAVKTWHYSGKFVANSQVNLGAFLDGKMLGALQFGPPMDRRKVLGLVHGTAWNGVLELNRMAFSDRLPRNSESRCIAMACRMIRKHAPHIDWILSYSDATQCGDGTIYRASGFYLTGVNPNKTIYVMPDGQKFTDITLRTSAVGRELAAKYGVKTSGRSTMAPWKAAGAKLLPGFQLRYMKPLKPGVLERFAVKPLPFSSIDKLGARMYRGSAPEAGDTRVQRDSGGATPTLGLSDSAEADRG